MIELKNVSFKYNNSDDNNYALNNINVNIFPNELVALVGANGSGKSTFGKLLNALLIPTKGNVFIFGINTSDYDNIYKIRQKVGYVFQNPENQIIGVTLETDVAFAPENLGFSNDEIEKRIQFALSVVGLLEKRKFMTSFLSGGQKQRLAIASVLAYDPEILVLDEPFAMLDTKSRNEIMELILKLKNEFKKTIILITHFMENTLNCDRLICLNHGQICFNGKPYEFFKNSENIITSYGLKLPFNYKLLNELSNYGFKFDDLDYQKACSIKNLSEIILNKIIKNKK